MNNEKEVPSPESDEADITSDVLNPLLVEMVLNMGMRAVGNVDDVEPEQLTEALTQEDRTALASLGSSEELVDKIISKAAGSDLNEQQSELPTSCEAVETRAEPGLRDHEAIADQDEGHSEGFDQMQNDVDNFDNLERVDFHFGYRKTDKLGSGGQGTVYLFEGEDEFAESRALKVFSPKSYGGVRSYVDDMQRLKSIASKIHKDPHDDLVEISWVGKHNGVYAMLMQYINGFDLRRLLQPELLDQLKPRVDGGRWKTINRVVYSVNGSQQLALQPAIAVSIIERVVRKRSRLSV